ncbi:intraflagellar transport protein 25 homolog isoform X2 [Xenia sp. Carnegie-2017]|uniref:intraflagellar transport protein 25 homolog isoform X2 n=1 Tax=Xenia sp. Carnegie-2017 TaxID=2897299 RepID=UPI001F03A3CA|nr:intraflagellar transport protein 25 homolog isoform X2 [Xenia sp. Carnegie-2017]
MTTRYTKMTELALSKRGACIGLSTAYDEKFPPENIIDGDRNSFWSTTGMFPQEFVISLPSTAEIDAIKMTCSNVKHMCIEKSMKQDPVHFERLSEKEMSNLDGQMQIDDFPVRMSKYNIRFQQLGLIICDL